MSGRLKGGRNLICKASPLQLPDAVNLHHSYTFLNRIDVSIGGLRMCGFGLLFRFGPIHFGIST